MSEEKEIKKEILEGEKFIISFEQYKPVLIKHPDSKRIYQQNRIHLNYYQILIDMNDAWKEMKFDAVLLNDGSVKVQDVYIDDEVQPEGVVYNYLARYHENFFAKCELPEHTDVNEGQIEYEEKV
jgi:hypothetical protein